MNDIDSLIFSLEEASKSSFTWFDSNFMRNNADKCQLLARSNEKVTTHSFPMHPFSTPENIRKPYDFLMFSGGRKIAHWERMGQLISKTIELILSTELGRNYPG